MRGDLSASESAEEMLSSKSEEQQDGRFSFAEIYTYIKDGTPAVFSKLISKHSERELNFPCKKRSIRKKNR